MFDSVCLIGPFPPPRHGQSSVNEAMAERMRREGFHATCLNTSPTSLDRSLSVKLRRIGPLLLAVKGLVNFGFGSRRSTAYFSLSGGWGILSEMVMVGIARCCRCKILVHHHNFGYLIRYSIRMHCLIFVAGKRARHIVLGNRMAKLLATQYRGIGGVIIVSNAVFLPFGLAQRTGWIDRRKRVGFLSNLTGEKGIFDVLGLAENAAEKKMCFRFEVAGPFANKEDEVSFHSRARKLTNLEYLGPLYGEKKIAFFQRIGVFLFPTHYVNEAEPIVLLEALRAGCAIIANERGCIAELVDKDCGVLVENENNFLAMALSTLTAWEKGKASYECASNGASAKFAVMRERGEVGITEVFSLLRNRN